VSVSHLQTFGKRRTHLLAAVGRKGLRPVDVLDPDALSRYGELCGWALAGAHARSGDAVAIGSYLGAGNT
jgi:Uncharacterized protein conserved in bacteria (DUF2252)